MTKENGEGKRRRNVDEQDKRTRRDKVVRGIKNGGEKANVKWGN